MEQKFYDAMSDCPIIAAVKDFEGIQQCLKSDVKIVFVLFGNMCNIGEIVKQIKQADKMALVHIDLIEGLSSHEIAVDYISKNTEADGIISTRMNMINRAKELSLYTIFRIFVLDSRAYQSIEKQKKQIKADFIEILPGVMPKIIQKINKLSSQSVIAGGLISDREDVIDALNAGAISVSTTNQDIWFM
ncbi:MAG: glycerol-3-phosphate responsive antiterminator [Lachnospiraceae bacterium]|nr:glycerol-3-phosphate responsive antiterminator [Lachnospiraceae bacterium]